MQRRGIIFLQKSKMQTVGNRKKISSVNSFQKIKIFHICVSAKNTQWFLGAFLLEWHLAHLVVWTLINFRFLFRFNDNSPWKIPWTIAPRKLPPGQFPPKSINHLTTPTGKSHLELFYCFRIITPRQLLTRAMTITNSIFSWLFSVFFFHGLII